ncbi:Hypothetical protein BC94_0469 [Mycoplasmopsis bovis]|uniref:Uncharacterized protein n=1 Tax=Mycoplasmopsis bovis TaxID=28903 RepID=A0A8D4A281_MYCBV|nr:Hypothetical protein BC85_0467 [Mycoplasmopsis bovis]AMW25747.1 Hypothetical protein BC94_0469 [Mycoplasmopsis bovis]AMW26376.1 Hypothetical protein BC93_0467 [Mycoplasmopsis bovis]
MLISMPSSIFSLYFDQIMPKSLVSKALLKAKTSSPSIVSVLFSITSALMCFSKFESFIISALSIKVSLLTLFINNLMASSSICSLCLLANDFARENNLLSLISLASIIVTSWLLFSKINLVHELTEILSFEMMFSFMNTKMSWLFTFIALIKSSAFFKSSFKILLSKNGKL